VAAKPMKMNWLGLFVAFLCILNPAPGRSQEMARRLTNQDVIEMVRLGLSDDVIIAKIRSVSSQDALKFDTSVEGLKALKAAKVSDQVIKVMINPAPAPVSAPAGRAPGRDLNLPPPEVGVYWQDASRFVPIEGQALSQAKVGGRAGSLLTYGVRGQHWDACIDGATSRNRVNDRHPRFYLYVQDGTSASDFVLIRLTRKKNRREFQIGSFGGVRAGKSGVKQSMEVPFRFEHVAIRTFKVTPDSDLHAGEYAFFMATGQQPMMAQGRISADSGGTVSGRIYDFSVPD
jgi:hypothetical protein